MHGCTYVLSVREGMACGVDVGMSGMQLSICRELSLRRCVPVPTCTHCMQPENQDER